MHSKGILDPEQLKALTEAVDDYCRDESIAKDSERRAEVARLVISMFGKCRSMPDLKATLTSLRTAHLI